MFNLYRETIKEAEDGGTSSGGRLNHQQPLKEDKSYIPSKIVEEPGSSTQHHIDYNTESSNNEESLLTKPTSSPRQVKKKKKVSKSKKKSTGEGDRDTTKSKQTKDATTTKVTKKQHAAADTVEEDVDSFARQKKARKGTTTAVDGANIAVSGGESPSSPTKKKKKKKKEGNASSAGSSSKKTTIGEKSPSKKKVTENGVVGAVPVSGRPSSTTKEKIGEGGNSSSKKIQGGKKITHGVVGAVPVVSGRPSSTKEKNGGEGGKKPSSEKKKSSAGNKDKDDQEKEEDYGGGKKRQWDSGLASLPPPSPRTHRAQRAEALRRQQQSEDDFSMESDDDDDYSASDVPGVTHIPGAGRKPTQQQHIISTTPTSVTSRLSNTTTTHLVEEGTISATLVVENDDNDSIDDIEREAKLTEKILEKIAVSAEAAEVVRPTSSKKKLIYIGVGICLLVVAVIIGVVVGVTLSDDDDDPNNMPSIHISDEEYLLDLVLPLSGEEALINNKDSAASKAFQWMLIDDVTSLGIDDIQTTDPILLIERYAMVVIYYSTGGPDYWFDQVGFLNYTSSICDWPYREEGDIPALRVKCNNDGRVTELALDFNNLKGTIPSEISGLEQMELLSFEINSLSGTLPSALGSLSRLENLALTVNMLTGTIPRELTELSTLESVFVWGNLLTGTIPEALTEQVQLESLLLSDNMFEGRIPEFAKRMELSELQLHNNLLTGSIPLSLFNLNNLIVFYAQNNELTGSISGLIKMTSLIYLDMTNNLLSGTIPDVSGLINLEALQLGSNRLRGSIPSSWCPCQKLLWLSLDNNSLDGSLPTEMGHLTNLYYLDIQSNSISGQIPSELSELTSLEIFRLQDNDIAGSLTDLCMRDLNYFVLEADCGPIAAEVSCSCCTTCCSDDSSCSSDPVGVCNNIAPAWSTAESNCDCQQQSNDDTVQMVCGGGTCESCNAFGTTCVTSSQYGFTFDEFGVVVGWKVTVEYVKGGDERIEYTNIFDTPDCTFVIDGTECRSCFTTGTCPDGTTAHFIDCRNVNDYGVYEGCFEDYGHEVFEALNMRETNTFYPEYCSPYFF